MWQAFFIGRGDDRANSANVGGMPMPMRMRMRMRMRRYK